MPKGHPLLAEFRAACQRSYACFILANAGVAKLAQVMQRAPSAPSGAVVFIGAEDPTKRRATAAIPRAELQELTQPDGAFTDTLAKSILVLLYAHWEEYYRPQLATAIGVLPEQVRSDLLGDLRLIRHCVVHAKSVVTNEHERIKVLSWPTSVGPLVITENMVTEFIELTHELVVSVDEVPPSKRKRT